MRYQRITQPLIRRSPRRLTPPLSGGHPPSPGGQLEPASWSEALDRAAAGFRRALEQGGPDSVGMFSCSKATNEVNYVAQKMMRVAIGSNNIDSCNRT